MANPLRGYREKHQLSQEQLADKLGISRAMVGMLENGERRYTVDMALRIEDRLGINRVLLLPNLFRRRAA